VASSPSSAPAAVSATEGVLRRDRAVILAGLFTVTAVAWAYMFYLVTGMDGMDGMDGMEGMDGIGASSSGLQSMAEMAAPRLQPWTGVDFVLMFVMWSVMMVAMMVPSAAPMILLFAKVQRNRERNESPFAPTSAFVLGYVLVWSAFSAVATIGQWALHGAALLSPRMVSTSSVLGGVLLIAAGIFQWTPLKRACLRHCRSPLHFFMTEWRDGARGALKMGIRHGAYCVGCCWALMAILFVAGVMNLLWVAAIAAFVLVEKLFPRGELIGRIAGGTLLASGLVLILRVF